MRRDDREVVTIEEIYDILQRCDTIRIALNDENGYPYVIPMTFGAELVDGKINIYFHSAKAGKKYAILCKDPRVCIEADLYYQVEKKASGAITALYESVIGWGKAVPMEDMKSKVAGLKHILLHYKETGFPATSCTGIPMVEVYKVELETVTGKHNL